MRKHTAAAKVNPKKARTPKEKGGSPAQAEVDSPQSLATTPATAATEPQEKHMTLTLKSLDKRGRNAIYHGAAVSLRLSLSAFPNKTAPASISVADGTFAVKTAREPRKRLTKEERAALPKPTLAERLAKAEARVAALRAKNQGAAAGM